MVNWVENGVAPGDAGSGFIGSGGGRTRPMCSFPQTAIHDGLGDPNLASSFSCGGNLQTPDAICQGLRTQYKKENTRSLQNLGSPYNGVSCGLEFAPVTAAALTPPATNDRFRNPLVTLSATDQGQRRPALRVPPRRRGRLDAVRRLVPDRRGRRPYAGVPLVGRGRQRRSDQDAERARRRDSAEGQAQALAECAMAGQPQAGAHRAEARRGAGPQRCGRGERPGGDEQRAAAGLDRKDVGPDWVVNDGRLYLRAERGDRGKGRGLHGHLHADRPRGNTSKVSDTVVVPLRKHHDHDDDDGDRKKKDHKHKGGHHDDDDDD